MPRSRRIALTGAVASLLISGTAVAAFQQLPPGDQVNNDAAAGIDPAKPVNLDDPTNADVVGGALAAGKPAVPWAVFRQQDRGERTTRSSRARSRAAPGRHAARHRRRSLERRAAVPRLAQLRSGSGRRGAGDRLRRHRPHGAVGHLVRGHERRGFGAKNIFASRFDNTGRNQGKWIFAGQGRGTGAAASRSRR